MQILPSSSLTDFSGLAYIGPSGTSADHASFWAAVDTTDPTKGRAAINGPTEVASDWLHFDTVAEEAWIRLMWSGTIATTGTHTAHIYPPQAANASYAVGDTFGQHNAYDASWAGYWPDGGGADRTANNNDGTANGGVTVGGATGQVGAATDFDGVDDSISLPDDIIGGQTQASLLAWFNADAIGGNRCVIGNLTASNEGWGLFIDNSDFITSNTDCLVWRNYITDAVEHSAIATASSSIQIGSWQFAAATIDVGPSPDAMTLRLDGTTKSTPDDTGDAPSVDSRGTSLGIGSTAGFLGTDPFDGRLQEIQLHTNARSDAWIAHEFAQTNDQATFWGTWSWTSGGGTTVTASQGATATATATAYDAAATLGTAVTASQDATAAATASAHDATATLGTPVAAGQDATAAATAAAYAATATRGTPVAATQNSTARATAGARNAAVVVGSAVAAAQDTTATAAATGYDATVTLSGDVTASQDVTATATATAGTATTTIGPAVAVSQDAPATATATTYTATVTKAAAVADITLSGSAAIGATLTGAAPVNITLTGTAAIT